MEPKIGNSGVKIMANFTQEQIKKAISDFYKTAGAKYKNAARDFFKQLYK